MSTQLLSLNEFIKKCHGEIVVSFDNESSMVSFNVNDKSGVKFFYLLSLSDFIAKFPRLAHADPIRSQFTAKLDQALKNSISLDIIENGVPSCMSLG